MHRARSRPVASQRRPESVLVVVYTDDAQALLLKRREPFEFWQSVTGSLEQGESPRDAARRELAEETGFNLTDDLIDTGISRQFTIDPRWRSRYPDGVTVNTEHEWRLRLPCASAIHISPEEHSEFGWFDLEEAIDSVWSWTNRDALQKLKESIS